jgi:hypothetical protein
MPAMGIVTPANYLMMGLGELAQNLNMAIQNYIQTVIMGRQA